jgi:hypothetical protein
MPKALSSRKSRKKRGLSSKKRKQSSKKRKQSSENEGVQIYDLETDAENEQ